MKVKNLHNRKDWDKYYATNIPLQVRLKSGVFTSYDIYLCDYLIKKYIPKYKKQSKKQPIITELGSGDGKLLEKIAGMINYKPIGIEYSPEAAKLAEINGVETIVGDVFDKKLLNKYRNRFDVVFSYGFIEHIIPPEKAVKVHLDMLKPGGYFIIQIPRFRGFNFLRLKFFRPDLIENHNIDIMNEDVLNNLCSIKGVKKIYCANYGTIKLRIPMDKKNVKYYFLKAICTLDYIINPACRILFGNKGFETYLFSPSVIYIGQKIE